MRRFRTGPETAWPITDYGSSFRLIRLLRSETKEARRYHLSRSRRPDPRHRAGLPQLFCVLEGSGWVSGDDDIEHPIASGEAAFWSHGELHATRTERLDGADHPVGGVGTRVIPDRGMTGKTPRGAMLARRSAFTGGCRGKGSCWMTLASVTQAGSCPQRERDW